MADTRTYIKVHDGIADHPKIEGLSDRAFRLLIETWCWCSRHLTDGQVPRSTWLKRGTAKARSELIAAGLAEDCDDVIVMHDYTEHQRCAAEVEHHRQIKRHAGLKGNHQRWHTGPTGAPDPTCEYCVSALDPLPCDTAPNGSHLRSQADSQSDRRRTRKRSPETEAEAENTNPHGAAGEVTLDRARDEDHACECAPAMAREGCLSWPPGPQPVPGLAVTGPHSGEAYRLVDRVIDRVHPPVIRTALAIEAGALLLAGTDPELVSAALALWLNKPRLGPKSLPSLVSEVIRTRDQPRPLGTADRRIAEAELLKDNPDPAVLAAAGIPYPVRLKALPGGVA